MVVKLLTLTAVAHENVVLKPSLFFEVGLKSYTYWELTLSECACLISPFFIHAV